jgi:hypothetical protein
LPEADDNGAIPLVPSVISGNDSRKFPQGSPQWWLVRLEKALNERAGRIMIYDHYYEGRQQLAFATEQFRKAFGRQFSAFADNWMQIVVDACEERLDVEGFRIPSRGKQDPTVGDAEAWDIWQANGMDAGSQMVHTDALVDAESYVLVGPAEEGSPYPKITGESPFQMIVESGAGYGAPRRAALKKWREDDLAYATLYLPDAVYKFVSKAPLKSNQTKIEWVRRVVGSEAWPLANDAGVVPVVAFCNRPRLARPPRSEIADLLPIQDGINKLFMDMLVASEYAGFRQRVATGVEIPTDPETGQPLTDLMTMALDRFLHTEDADAKFYTLEASDLGNYTNAIAMAIQHLASRSSTPPHYFLASMGNFPSGEALKAAETGLVSKVRRKMRLFGEDWEEVIRLAFLFAGKTGKAQAARAAETIWHDPESRTESEHIDAIVKLSSLNVPEEMLWEKSGWFSPQEIQRMKDMLAAGAAVATPPPDTGTQAGG